MCHPCGDPFWGWTNEGGTWINVMSTWQFQQKNAFLRLYLSSLVADHFEKSWQYKPLPCLWNFTGAVWKPKTFVCLEGRRIIRGLGNFWKLVTRQWAGGSIKMSSLVGNLQRQSQALFWATLYIYIVPPARKWFVLVCYATFFGKKSLETAKCLQLYTLVMLVKLYIYKTTHLCYHKSFRCGLKKNLCLCGWVLLCLIFGHMGVYKFRVAQILYWYHIVYNVISV